MVPVSEPSTVGPIDNYPGGTGIGGRWPTKKERIEEERKARERKYLEKKAKKAGRVYWRR